MRCGNEGSVVCWPLATESSRGRNCPSFKGAAAPTCILPRICWLRILLVHTIVFKLILTIHRPLPALFCRKKTRICTATGEECEMIYNKRMEEANHRAENTIVDCNRLTLTNSWCWISRLEFFSGERRTTVPFSTTR